MHHINLGLPMTVLNVMLPIVKQETTICRLYERWSSMIKWRIDNECYIGLDATGEPELRQWGRKFNQNNRASHYNIVH